MMRNDLKEMLLTQQRGLDVLSRRAKVNICRGGKGVILFAVLEGAEADVFLEACAQSDDLEDDQEQSLSDAHHVRALPPEHRTKGG